MASGGNRVGGRQLILDIQPEAPPRFANFRPGANQEALMTLRALAQGESKEKIVYLWGAQGCGRSHVLLATVAEARECGLEAHYFPAGSELPDLISGLIAVDDVELLDEAGQIRLFSLINQVREGAGGVLAAGRMAPAQLTVRADLSTRLGWGLVYALHGLDEAERANAVRERAAARGVDFPEDVIRYLLTHGRRDLPSLLATVDAVDGYSLSLKRPVTVPLVREWLQQAVR